LFVTLISSVLTNKGYLKIQYFLKLFIFSSYCIAQNIGIGTTAPIEKLHVVGNKALFETNFVGIGTITPTTGYTGFSMKNNVNSWYGMFIDAGTTGRPFYGYAQNGVAKAFTELNGSNGNWELYYNVVSLAVSPTGNIGIGTITPSQKLDVAGTIHASNLNGGATTLSTDASGNTIRTPSDANLKNNITDINGALTKVLQMHGVTYNFKDADRFGSNRQIGFLAQELEKIVPEAVSSGGEYKSVNYQVLTALLTEAVKEQQREINAQQAENENLKKDNFALQKDIMDIKIQIVKTNLQQSAKMAFFEIKINELIAVKEKPGTSTTQRQ
jgi:Chaperone of endosialidase